MRTYVHVTHRVFASKQAHHIQRTVDKKLFPVAGVYVITTLMIFAFRGCLIHYGIDFAERITNILAYGRYSWYVELYIGLFLFILFLNLMWDGLESRKSHAAGARMTAAADGV